MLKKKSALKINNQPVISELYLIKTLGIKRYCYKSFYVGLFIAFYPLFFSLILVTLCEIFLKSSFFYPFIFAFLIVYVSIELRTLGNILHECAHNSFFRTRKHNHILGHIIAFLIFENFKDYKHCHFSHHYNTCDMTHDGDLKTRLFLGIHLKESKVFYLKKILSPLNILRALWAIFNFSKNNIAYSFLKVCYLGILFTLVFYFHFYWILICFFLPFVTFYQYLKFFSDIADHARLTSGYDIYTKTRNHIFKFKVLNFIFFPRYDAYHMTHHMYPTIGVRYLEKLHNYLLIHDLRYKAKKHDF